MAAPEQKKEVDVWGDLKTCWGCCWTGTKDLANRASEKVQSDEFKQDMKDAYNTTKGKVVDGYQYVTSEEFKKGVSDGAGKVWDGTKWVATAAYETVNDPEFQQTAKDTAAVGWDVSKKWAKVAGDGIKEGVQNYKQDNNMK